jgi:DNA-binding ferritin-like protein
MSTTQTKAQPTIDAAYSHIKEWNEQMIEAARKAGTQSVDTYANAVDRAIDIERKLGEVTKQEWLKSLIEAHADMAKDLIDAYTSSIKSLLK